MSASAFPVFFESASASPDGVRSARELALFFARTDAGDAELGLPLLALTTPVRQLLSCIEQARTIDLCIAAAGDCNLADAMLLLRRGLIHMESLRANGASRATERQLHMLVRSILQLPPDELYTLLTQHAKLRLGLLHGFRMILALERCVGHEEQRALAVRFVEDVWRAHGEAGIRPLSAALRGCTT